MAHHPLQRLPSPSRTGSALLHLSALVSFALNFRYLLVTENPINDSFGWHFQFLTIIGLSLCTTAFTAGLLADVFLSTTLFRLKNTLVVACSPLEILISMLYWGLRAIDPALVIPKMAPPLNVFADLGFHLVPSAVMLVDLLFFSPPSKIGALPAVGVSTGIAIAYWFWVEECFRNNGFYPYPIFDAAGFNGRVGLFVMSAVIMASGMVGLKALHGVINGTEKESLEKESLKKKE